MRAPASQARTPDRCGEYLNLKALASRAFEAATANRRAELPKNKRRTVEIMGAPVPPISHQTFSEGSARFGLGSALYAGGAA